MCNIVEFIFLTAFCYTWRDASCCCNAFRSWSERQEPAILKSTKPIACQLHSYTKNTNTTNRFFAYNFHTQATYSILELVFTTLCRR